MNVLDGKGAEFRIVGPRSNVDHYENPGDRLHGTNMFAYSTGVEDNIADWLAFHLTFQRVKLGDDVMAIIGCTGDSMYVALETPETIETAASFEQRLRPCVARVSLGPSDDPWSKSTTVYVGRRLDWHNRPSKRRSTKFGRETLGVQSGRPFAVQISLDGKTFVPEAGASPLLITLR
jgi:hypothetical protein